MNDPVRPNEVTQPATSTGATTRPVGDSEANGGLSLSAGNVLSGRYRIDSFLDRGGMGEVFRATDLDLGVTLALKTIRPEIASNPTSLRRFKQEVLLARSVSHPNVCRTFDLGRDEASKVAYLTMEYLDGVTLSARIRRTGSIPPDEGLHVVCQLADGLDAAHRAGVVHRDFKSANVVLVPGHEGERAVITDFGLAMVMERPEPAGCGRDIGAAGPADLGPPAGSRLTVPGLVGSPAYMSPEQVRGEAVGPASDLYALGVVLFEMATGRLPFHGDTPLETARARLEQEPPAPSSLAEVDPCWEDTILRLLSIDPAKRHSSGRDVVQALQGRLTGEVGTRQSLPAERDTFVGRDAELATLRHLLASTPTGGTPPSPATRLVNILGPGGIGKTRIALRFGWECLGHFPGGVWFCDLSDARSVDGIVAATASGLNVPLGKGNPVIQLGQAMAAQEASLVILDNFEQVVEHADATLGKWLTFSGASFLVTSRERLHLEGETTFALESLHPKSEGMELFEQRARLHSPGFRVDETNRGLVQEIVTRLEGLPLAIELAAARLRVLSLNQLNERLADRLKVLGGGKRGRQSTLRSTLDWSWELMTPWERSAAAQASVFERGFSLEAAEAVIDLSGLPEAPSVLDVIQSLVDKSWLRTRVAFRAPRFEMYAALQEYAGERLRAAGGETETGATKPSTLHQATFARHLDHCVNHARRTVQEHWTGNEAVCLQLLDIDHGNFLAALERPGGGTKEESEKKLQLATTLNDFWSIRGHYSTARRVLSRLLELPGVKDTMTVGRAEVYSAIALYAHRQGEYDLAKREWEEALRLYERVDDQVAAAGTLHNLGLVAQDQGDLDRADVRYNESYKVYRQLGHRRRFVVSLQNLGNVAVERGDFALAESRYLEALALSREFEDRRKSAAICANLSNVAMNQGDFDRSRDFLHLALANFRELDDKRGISYCLTVLGNVDSNQGDLKSARSYHEQCLCIRRELGDKKGIALSLNNLATVVQAEGDLAGARELYESSLEIGREIRDTEGTAMALYNVATILIEAGDFAKARMLLRESLELREAMGAKEGIVLVLTALGSIEGEEGHHESALAALEKALVLNHEIGNRLVTACVLESLATLFARMSKLATAARFLGVASMLREKLGTPRQPGEQTRLDALILAIRSGVKEGQFPESWEEGRELSVPGLIDEVGVLRREVHGRTDRINER